MVTIGFSMPKQIIKDVREILDRTIMAGKRVEIKIVPEDLERKNWAAKKWVITHQITIVPNQVPLETGKVHQHRPCEQQQQLEPHLAQHRRNTWPANAA